MKICKIKQSKICSKNTKTKHNCKRKFYVWRVRRFFWSFPNCFVEIIKNNVLDCTRKFHDHMKDNKT